MPEPTPPTPFEQSLDADTALVVQDAAGPAETVILISGDDGAEHPLRALYEAPGLDVAPGAAHAPVLSTAPVLHIQVSLVQSALGRELSTRDAFIVRGKTWRTQRPAPDGFGLVAVKLLSAPAGGFKEGSNG